MQLGFNSAILPDADLESLFQTAQSLGYDCIEVMCWPPGGAERRYAGVTHIDVTALDAAKIEQIGALSQQYGVAISSLGYYPNALSPNQQESEAAVAQIHRVIEAAAQLRIHRVTTFIGRDPTASVEDNWPRFLSTWPPIINAAAERGVSVGIENCPMLYGDEGWPGGKNLAISPTIWRRMFEAIPSTNFGLNYDPSHLIWMHMDYLAPMREFADRLIHVHAKDARIDRDQLNDHGILADPSTYHTPKLPGLGDVNWAQFFSTLGDVGYRGPVCVEVEDRIYEVNQTTRLQSLQQSAAYLRQFIPLKANG
ncbi:MAG: sugar phosphate isomerase/epimerase family protein [Planctomycetota bacterium]